MVRPLLALLLIALVVGLGYAGYGYLKNTPPAWLIKLATHTAAPPPLPSGERAPLTAPEGFIATIFSRDVPGARVMIRDPKGTMLVSETLDGNKGKVVALPDDNGDGVADNAITVLENLHQPHGLAVICNPVANPPCMLYVADTDELRAYTYDAETRTATFVRSLVGFPVGDGHYTRTLLPTADQKGLLIAIGSSCNVCREANALRASIQLYDIATGKMTEYATGLRNSVFMARNYITGDVWATENSRDLLGDDIPPDEVNVIRQAGNYGWPICYGANLHDTDFDRNQYIRDPCADAIPPRIGLQAHSAALGLSFVPEEGWPDGWGNDLLVAYHGSWNRSVPTGYKVVRFDLDDSGNVVNGPIDFLTGFIPPESNNVNSAIGRPVGVLAEPGGTVYISDDRAGAIYKVSSVEATR